MASARNGSLATHRTISIVSPRDIKRAGEPKVDDLLFVKVPLPFPGHGLSERSKDAGYGQSNKGLAKAECLGPKASATNRLLQRLASKKASCGRLAFVGPDAVTSTAQLEAQVRHQLSRKGNVKLSTSRPGNESSPTETVEVVCAVSIG